MKVVAKHIQKRRRELHEHPFFSWLSGCGHPLESRFLFAPIVAEFVMGFADMNKWFLEYGAAATPLHRAINEHTLEDRTHSRLFVEDWVKLRLDSCFDWSPSKTLWWWFECEKTEFIRRSAMETLDLTVTHPDPLVRFPMMEAIEVCGDVFFANTVKVATELEQQTGLEYRYWGEYHRARETGHLHTDERGFFASVLTPEQRQHAIRLADRMFDMFLEDLDHVLEFSRLANETPHALAESLEHEYRGTLSTPMAGSPRPSQPPGRAALAESQARVRAAFSRRRQLLADHPFLDWLRNDAAVSPLQKLQRFVPLWAVDVLGYKDFNLYVLKYQAPADAKQRAINRWTDDLASHGVLYLRDWMALGLDRVLPWSAHEVIQYYFLGEHSELHRHSMAKGKRYAFSYPSPVLRYWLMRAWEAGGEILFEALGPLVRTIEARGGPVLDYWGGRHWRAEPDRGPDPEADAVVFEAEPLTPDEERTAIELIEGMFDNLEELFSLSLRVAESNYFRVTERTERFASERPADGASG